MSEQELSTLRLENERLRAELARLERERADEQGMLRTAQARRAALQASLDEAHHHLAIRRSVPQRAVDKARRIVGRTLRAVRARIR